jgi:signal transduction histidine kinase
VKRLESETIELLGVPTFLLERAVDGRIVVTDINQAWRDTAGLGKDQVIGKTAAEVYPGRHGAQAYQHHLDCFTSAKKMSYDLMLPLGGTVRSARTILMPALDDNRQVAQIVGTSIDMTAQADAAEMLTNVETLTGEIEGFISLAAHDLRTPMRHVAMLTELLREDFVDKGDGKLEIIDALEDVATKAGDLIHDVLSHAQATSSPNPHKKFRLDKLCRDIFVVLDPMQTHEFVAKKISLESDMTALQIVLRNLFDNAFKYSGRDSVTLKIEVTQTHERTLCVAVQDDGNGFKDPAVAFLDGGRLRVDSGFGLLGVRRLVKARGGWISAENLTDTAGSLIRFTLPGRIVQDVPTNVTAIYDSVRSV